MNRNRSRCWIVVALGLLMMGTAVWLHAHTKLLKSEPTAAATLSAAPKQIQLWFDEKIDPAVSKIEVVGAAGKLGLGPARAADEKSLVADVTGAVTSGAYSIVWQTAGEDGHIVKGALDFSVKLPD